MKAKEIRELTDAEAVSKVRDLRQEIFNLRLQQQTAQLERASRIRDVRRDIARIETILSERRIAAESTAASE